MTQRVPIRLPLASWSSKPVVEPGFCGRWTRNWHARNGYLQTDQGFQRFRQVEDVTGKAASSWVHRHTDGTERILYYVNDSLFEEDGTDNPSALKTGLTEVFCPMFANMAIPFGASMFVNGTDAPQLVRENSVGTALEVVAANLEKPDDNWTATSSTTGGNLADGTYHVRIAQRETNQANTTVQSAPSAVKTVTISSGGGSGSITVAHSTWTPNTRADTWRIGISSSTDAPANFLTLTGTYDDVAIGTTSVVVQDVGTATAFTNRNGLYQTADLTDLVSGSHPRGVIIHEGRFFIWYDDDNDVFWSERGIWGWYTTNSIDNGAEGGWNLPVKAMVSTNGFIVVFTSASIHGLFGTFVRDSVGDNATFAADATPRVLETGIGILGGPEAAKNIGGAVFFISTRGPAVFRGSAIPIQPEHMDQERRCWDTQYADRWIVAEDPVNRMVCFAVTRLVNSSRAMDGASVAGICDTVYRFDGTAWSPPLWLDVVHLTARTNGTVGAASNPTYLMAMGPNGSALRLNFGWSGGAGTTDTSTADFDAKTASSSTTTTVVVALAGVSADDYKGWTLTLEYPTDDANYPGVLVQKTITTNTATVAGNVTFTWAGALTVPSGTNWSVRLAGTARPLDTGLLDLRDVLQGAADDVHQVHVAEARWRDLIGAEASS